VVPRDSFHGVRFLSAKSAQVIGVRRCLGRTFRSQGFTPSQRFSPTRAWWLYFTPLPPIGFRSSELFPHRQPRHLSMSVALLSFASLRGYPANWSPSSALAIRRRPRLLSVRSSPEIPSCPSDSAGHHPCRPLRLRVVVGVGERSRSIQRVGARRSPGSPPPPFGEMQRHRASLGVDFRALIQRRVRSWGTGVIPRPGRCSLDLSPSEVCQLDRWTHVLPSSAFDMSTSVFRRASPHRGGPGYRSNRAWERLRRVPPTSYGFFTSPFPATRALGYSPKAFRICLACARSMRATGETASSSNRREAVRPSPYESCGRQPLITAPTRPRKQSSRTG
jgi:hypothetical protein